MTENKSKKVINLMRVISECQWDEDKTTVLRIFRGMIRPIFDYGCKIYRAAAKINLDLIQAKL